MLRKIAVIGRPGAGKSAFSGALRDRTGLPLYDLDQLWQQARPPPAGLRRRLSAGSPNGRLSGRRGGARRKTQGDPPWMEETLDGEFRQ